MGNSSSICVYLQDLTNIICCRAINNEFNANKSDNPSHNLSGQSTFYISTPTPSLISTSQSSPATTISKSNSEEWYDIDLRVYRPLSTPIKNSGQRFGGDGSILFIPDHLDIQSTRKKIELPGIHHREKKPNLWEKTKQRLVGNQQQSHIVTKRKSEEMLKGTNISEEV